MFQDEGYRDPNTGEIRRVPFEIMVEGDKTPIYEETLEDVRRFNENPALPFNAFGTLALARAEFDANSGSSQVFFLLKVSSNCYRSTVPLTVYWWINFCMLLYRLLMRVQIRIHAVATCSWVCIRMFLTEGHPTQSLSQHRLYALALQEAAALVLSL